MLGPISWAELVELNGVRIESHIPENKQQNRLKHRKMTYRVEVVLMISNCCHLTLCRILQGG